MNNSALMDCNGWEPFLIIQKRSFFISGDDSLLFTSNLVPNTAKYNTGKVYNLNVAVSASGARYVSKRGDIEFFKGGKDAIFRGPNNIEKSCTRR